MQNNKHFSNWIRQFEELTSRCQASTIIKKGYLLSDGRVKLKIKLLLRRFDEAIRDCTMCEMIMIGLIVHPKKRGSTQTDMIYIVMMKQSMRNLPHMKIETIIHEDAQAILMRMITR